MAPDRAVVARAAPRRKVFRLAWLQVGDERHRAHVLNVSPFGACLHVAVPLRAWGPVVVHLGDQVVDARVTWAAGNRCGLKFVRELSPEVFAALLD